jgi:hypothetical protein
LDAGEKARIQLFLSLHARKQLDRLARHRRYTVTALIEEWAASAERRATSRLSPKALKRYYEAAIDRVEARVEWLDTRVGRLEAGGVETRKPVVFQYTTSRRTCRESLT